MSKLHTTPQPDRTPAPFDLQQFAKLAATEMEKHDFHGFEPIVLAVTQQLLAEKEPDRTAELEAECYRLNLGISQWLDKTDWVQKRKKWPFPVLGMHLADVMTKHIEELEAEVARLREAADHAMHDINDLIANSRGVAGLHRNGDIAEWGELLEGGRNEGWLGSMALLEAALAAHKGQP